MTLNNFRFNFLDLKFLILNRAKIMNMSIIEDAKNFALNKHNGKFRKDGFTPYSEHLKEVVDMLSTWKYKSGFFQDEINIFRNYNVIYASAWLHDTLEKTDTHKEELMRFGIRVMNQVVKISFKEDMETEEEYFKRNYDNVIKLADHICNTFYFMNNNLVDWREYYKKGMILVDNFKQYNFCKNEICEIEKNF